MRDRRIDRGRARRREYGECAKRRQSRQSTMQGPRTEDRGNTGDRAHGRGWTAPGKDGRNGRPNRNDKTSGQIGNETVSMRILLYAMRADENLSIINVSIGFILNKCA